MKNLKTILTLTAITAAASFASAAETNAPAQAEENKAPQVFRVDEKGEVHFLHDQDRALLWTANPVESPKYATHQAVRPGHFKLFSIKF